MINIYYLNIDNISLKEKSNENILIYDFAYKAPYNVEHLRIAFHKVKRYIKKHDGTKWLSVRLRTKWFWVRVQLQSLQ